MNLSKPTTLTAAALAAGLFLLPTTRVSAQDAATTPSVSSTAPAPPPNGERPPGNPEDFRQRMTERLKTQLKASDDEWTVIQPLLEKTVEKLAASRGGGGGFGGPGGPGGNREGGNREGGRRREGNNNGGGNNQNAGGNQPAAAENNNQGGGNRNQRREGGGGQRGGTPETQALRTALDDDNSTVNDVKAKLQAVRDQRKQAATDLTQAREELRKVLNMRQEAALVMDGILD